MMKKFLLRLFAIVAIANLALCAHAQSAKIITLKDGSVIKGEVTQLADGIYTLKTSNLGEIRVPEVEVVSIASEGTPAPAPSTTENAENASLKGQVQQLQTNLLSDPEIMGEIQNIMQDPEIRGVLSDPAFMQAIMSYNPDQIQQNEKTQYLLQNPKFQSLMEKIRQKVSSQP